MVVLQYLPSTSATRSNASLAALESPAPIPIDLNVRMVPEHLPLVRVVSPASARPRPLPASVSVHLVAEDPELPLVITGPTSVLVREHTIGLKKHILIKLQMSFKLHYQT